MDFETLFTCLRKGPSPEKSFLSELFPRGPWFFPKSPKGNLEKKNGLFLQKEDFVQGQKVSAFFVGETPSDFKDSKEGGLLSKIITGLKLPPGKIVRIFQDPELSKEEFWSQLHSYLQEFRPKVLVALGARATHFLLGDDKRLGLVHGRPFPLQVLAKKSGEKKFQIICFPVFHSDILHINPNMKRTAWRDLQKVRNYLIK